MRCAIKFDKSKALADQEVKAWGELQSLKDEPEYKESDIKGADNKMFFFSYKCAMDDTWADLDSMVFDEVLTEEQANSIKSCMEANLYMILFDLLDGEDEDVDDIEWE